MKLFPNLDVSNEGLPFMGYKEADLFGVPAKIYRISLSTSVFDNAINCSPRPLVSGAL